MNEASQMKATIGHKTFPYIYIDMILPYYLEQLNIQGSSHGHV